uniref:S100/CaBP-9k-type calcium binding subdomain domain-containing protein n=1 Tax=Pundamilia nyererei TaxID=303518 RepID=A0A3B4FZY3_9CICH
MDTQMSKLEEAMEEVLDIFKQKCTQSKTMMKKDLKRTLRAELVNWLQVQLILFNCKDKTKRDNILRELDENPHDCVNFEEFVYYVTRLMMCGHYYLQK